MTDEVKEEISILVNASLDDAENVWNQVGEKVTAKMSNFSEASEALSVPTQLPGYDWLEEGKPLVDEFIAFVLDMRCASRHLNEAIANTGASQLQRIYYETTALLPATTRLIRNEEGGVTEYLGDGLLAFFKVDKDKPKSACYRAHGAATDCMNAVREIINPILAKRYKLPPIAIGIGMAHSKAILTLIGDRDLLKPIAFGKCVFYATKLSRGVNEIWIDYSLKVMWPKSDNGKLRFRHETLHGVDGYLMYR